MSRTLLTVAAVIVWLALPLVLGIARGMVHGRWMLQESPREYGFMVGVGIAWLLPIMAGYVWSTWGNVDWRGGVGLFAWSILSGVVGGQLVLNLANHAETAHGQAVEFKIVGQERVAVRLRIVDDAYDGVTFKCARGQWHYHRRGPAGTAPGMIYRGRLGLLWGEFREQ
jgi:hypothetical protein